MKDSGAEKVTGNCWQRIGTWGKSAWKCERLVELVHCRNCDVFTGKSLDVFEKELPEDYRREWTDVLMRSREKAARDTISVIVLKLGDELMAISAVLCKEIIEMLMIHRLPHNRNRYLRGIVNTGGEVQICFSFGAVLGVSRGEDHENEDDSRLKYGRMIIMEKAGKRFVFPVTEVLGIHRYRQEELEPLPATVSGAASNFIKGIIKWGGHHVGCLDEDLLISQIERSLR